MEKPHANDLRPFNPREKNYHSNLIIESRHDFSLLEKKIMYCVINQLKTNLPGEEGYQDMYFKIPSSVFGKDYSSTALKTACQKIITRSITGGDKKNKKFWGFVPFPWFEFSDGQLHIKLQSEAVPYFIDLKLRGYTAYELDIALSLGSVYSQRLYELLSRWKDTCKWYKVDIEDLKYMLSIDKDKTFTGPLANGNLRTKVLEPARRELAEKTDIEFQYSLEKEGRKFVRINFDIFTKKLKKHIEGLDAKADKQAVLEELNAAPKEQQMVFLHTALSQYGFTEKGKGEIIDSLELTLKFIEVHMQLVMGISEPEGNPTNYIAGILRSMGWTP